LIVLPSLAVSVHAASVPDLTVENIWLEDASQVVQPITEVSPGQSFNIIATIKNIGQETASGYYLEVYYDSDYGRGGPDNIAPGEVQTWYVGPLTAQAGIHTTKWVVDPDNQIAELAENNNQKELAFTVGSTPETTTVTSSLTSSTTSSTMESTSTESTSTTTTTVASNSTSSTTQLTSTSTSSLPVTYALGWLPEDIPNDARVTPVVSAALPTHFEWTQNWMTSVKNQGGCGSCVAFAAVGALEGQLKIQANNPSWNIDLSEQHLFSCGGGTCSGGWYISSALNYLQQYGTPDEACSPYQGQSGSGSCSKSCPDWQSRASKISSWSWVANNPSALQAALVNGPLVAGFYVYTDFLSYSGGVYHYDGHSPLAGGHAIVIVGYDSTERYWIVKNSWGSGWGDGGYFRIGFGEAGIEDYVASVTASLSASMYSVTFYTDPSSGNVTADGATNTNGQASTYLAGQRVHITATPPSGYSFANWEVSRVAIDSQLSLDTWITVSSNGWLKAHYTPVNSITLSFANYPYMFVVGQTTSMTVVVGVSQSHPPSGLAHTIDVVGTNLIVASLSNYADTGGLDAMMDVQAAHAVESSIVLDVAGNIISTGGPGVNYVWRYYNDKGTLPAYFDASGTIYVSSTGHHYSMTNMYGGGQPVTDYAIIELYNDGGRNVLLVAGLSGYATYYASKWLAAATVDGTIQQYNAQAIILKLYDPDGLDPLVTPPTITVQETA